MNIVRNLKKVFSFIAKEIFSSIIFLTVLIAIGAVVGVSLTKEYKDKSIPIEPNTYLYVSFPDGVKEDRVFQFDFLRTDNKSLTFYETIYSLKRAKNDPNIGGVILDLDNLTLPFSQIEELRAKLMELKTSGKKVFAYGNYLNKNSYVLGSIANKIYMNPSTSTDLTLDGFQISLPYYKKLIDKVGVEFQVVHIGDFKTFGENYTKNKISKELKTQYQQVLNGRLDYFGTEIPKSRNIDKLSFNNNFLNGNYMFLDSSKALSVSLIDKQASYEDFLKLEDIDTSLDINEYNSQLNKIESNNQIALIIAEGDISYNGFTDGISPDNMIPLLDSALKNVNIKGIVIRINSPGGSALGSELIYQKIKKVKSKKPIYVSIGETAASGGYYIASNANKIYADRNSITGSIGVVSLFFNLENIYDKLGVNFEKISLGKTPKSFNNNQSIDLDELTTIKNNMINTYNEFKNRVAEGRKIKIEKVEELAQGKIYTGDEAKKLGLIDDIGGLDFTINKLAKDLKLANYEVTTIHKDFDKLKEYMNISNYIKSDKIMNKFNKIQNKIDYLKELNGRPSLLLPVELNEF